MNGGHETNGIAAMEEKEKSRRHCVLTYSAILASVTALILCSASLFLGSFQLHSNGNQQPQTKPLFDELGECGVEQLLANARDNSLTCCCCFCVAYLLCVLCFCVKNRSVYCG